MQDVQTQHKEVGLRRFNTGVRLWCAEWAETVQHLLVSRQRPQSTADTPEPTNTQIGGGLIRQKAA